MIAQDAFDRHMTYAEAVADCCFVAEFNETNSAYFQIETSFDDGVFEGGFVYRLNYIVPHGHVPRGLLNKGNLVVVDKTTGRLLRATWTEDGEIESHDEQPAKPIFIDDANFDEFGDVIGLYPQRAVHRVIGLRSGGAA